MGNVNTLSIIPIDPKSYQQLLHVANIKNY